MTVTRPAECATTLTEELEILPGEPGQKWCSSVMRRALKVLAYVLVTVYFAADLVFAAVTRPLSAWIERLQILRRLNAWITGLRPYPALALFSVPVVILEPVKPVGAFLVSAGHVMEGTLTIVLGEILKITLVERLFKLTRNRLMQIPVFAIVYGRWIRFHEWMTSSEIWRWMRGQKDQMKLLFKRAVASIGVARSKRRFLPAGNGRTGRKLGG